MPYKRNYKKKRAPRRRRKKANYSPSQATPFAEKYMCNLRFVGTGSLNPSAASLTADLWSMNSLYDPDRSHTGHQPMGYDQLAALYNRYVVTGARISCTFTNQDAAHHIYVGMTGHENATFYTGSNEFTTLIESGNTVYKCLEPVGGKSSCTLRKNVNLRKEFAVRDLIGNIEEYGAICGNNPNNEYFVSTWASGQNVLDDPAPLELFVQIDYHGYFIEPKLLGQS